MGLHECDLLILGTSNYLTEIEIKTTKSDLVKDLKKRHGHHSDKIKWLYYAVPLSILKDEIREIVPVRAGLLSVSQTSAGYTVRIERKPSANAGTKPVTDEERFKLARLGALRIWDLKERLQKIREAMK